MKLVFVDSLPKRTTRGWNNKLQQLIEEFAHSSQKIAKIDCGEGAYKSPIVCYSSVRAAAKRANHPVKVVMRQGDVYLVKV